MKEDLIYENQEPMKISPIPKSTLLDETLGFPPSRGIHAQTTGQTRQANQMQFAKKGIGRLGYKEQ